MSHARTQIQDDMVAALQVDVNLATVQADVTQSILFGLAPRTPISPARIYVQPFSIFS